MIRKLLLLSAICAAIALAAVWASPRDSEAMTWNPFFGPSDFYRLDPLTTNTATDLHAQFNVFAPSANFSGQFGRAITFGDGDVFTEAGPAVPNGAYIGSLSSVATLGLANEGCNSTVPVTFNFVDAQTSTAARPFTNPAGGMTVGAGGIAGGVDDDLTDFTYSTAGGVDPLGLKQGADVAGLGTAPEGTRLAAANEIRVDTEEMLVVGVDTGTAGGGTYRVIRGWNNTAVAAHSAGAVISRVAVIYSNGPGSNLLANLGEDDGDVDNNGVDEEATGPAGGPQTADNQVADGADLVPNFVRDSQIPSVNPDDGTYVPSRARYAGVAFVASSLIVILQFSIMEPGALTTFPNLQWATTAWGYPSVTFLQDPLAAPSDSAITDFCNFSSNTFLFGTTHDNLCTGASPPGACTGTGAGFTLRLAVDGGCPGTTSPNECGTVRSRTPLTAQRVRYYQYSVSQRDYDSDNHENALDTCPYHYNPGWDPREFNVSSGGDDGDGLPTACDPSPAGVNTDHDGDGGGTGWLNRLDNCPTIANVGTPAQMAQPNNLQYDADDDPGINIYDGGPSSDSIGPVCDIPANTCTTAAPFLCPVAAPTLVADGPNGHYHAAYAAQIICIGGANDECSATVDSDGDGVVNGRDTCRGGANPPTTFPLGNVAGGPTGKASTLSAGTLAGATSVTVVSAAGFTTGSPIVIRDPLETVRYITSIVGNTINFGEGLAAAHQAGDAVEQISFAQGLRDLNNSGFADTGDMAFITGAFGTTGGNPALSPGYAGRLDINSGVPSNAIDTGDMAQITGVFGATCGPP